MMPDSSMRRTRSVTAGVERPIRRPSSEKEIRASCCRRSRMLQPTSSSSLWGLANVTLNLLLLTIVKFMGTFVYVTGPKSNTTMAFLPVFAACLPLDLKAENINGCLDAPARSAVSDRAGLRQIHAGKSVGVDRVGEPTLAAIGTMGLRRVPRRLRCHWSP